MFVAVSQHATSPLGGVQMAAQSEFCVQCPVQPVGATAVSFGSDESTTVDDPLS
jgi:hypothetical protein